MQNPYHYGWQPRGLVAQVARKSVTGKQEL
jgi:hypothetical protein